MYVTIFYGFFSLGEMLVHSILQPFPPSSLQFLPFMHLNGKGQSKNCVHLRESFAPKYLFKCDYMHGVVCQLILLLFVIDYRTLIFF